MTYTDLVDATAAIDPPGHCLIGPYLPFSLVRLGPDNPAPSSTTGYISNRPIQSFGHTHVAGTGGGGRYGNIGVTPFLGVPRPHHDPQYQDGEQAEPGYYRVRLTPTGILAELSSSMRCGIHRYSFPAGLPAHIAINAAAAAKRAPDAHHHPGHNCATCVGSTVEWISDQECCGSGTFVGGWGHQFPYTIHFFARFDTPTTARRVYDGPDQWPGTCAQGRGAMAVASFGDQGQTIILRVGISHVSVAKARASLDRELGANDFDTIRAQAKAVWEQALSRIRVVGDEQHCRLFYTYLYRLLCMPSDLGIDDEFPSWHSGVRHFTDIYALWDSVRNANSLFMLFQPDLTVDLLNCQLDIARHIGWLPDAWIAGHSAMVQGGSSSDILFCEARWKALKGIDYDAALSYMRKNAEVDSPDPWLYGRHLAHYREHGFVPSGIPNCVSRHLEYSYQDWCIGHLAADLGDAATAARFHADSRKLWNLWRADRQAFAPRSPDGTWIDPWQPTQLSHACWDDPYFYEASGRQWLWNAHHDFAGLIARLGGPEAFVDDLERFVLPGCEGTRAPDRFITKETMLHVPWLYHYAGRPELSCRRVRTIMAHNFALSRKGLRDNEDMGCQAAFLLGGQMGLYPIMGQDHYLLAPPVFERVEMDLGRGGDPLIIEHPGADAGHTAVQRATLNGTDLPRAYVHHHEIVNGAVLRYTTGPEPSTWGASPPPSMLDRE